MSGVNGHDGETRSLGNPLHTAVAPAEPEPLTIPERPAPCRDVDRTITGPSPMVCIT